MEEDRRGGERRKNNEKEISTGSLQMCITIMGQFAELIIIMLLRKEFYSVAQT